MKKAKIGVIGAGWWATEFHIPHLKEKDDVELTSVCKIEEDELKFVKEKFGFKHASTDYIVWPMVTKIIFLILMIVGASAGSTSGGLKLLRINLAFKVAMRELVRIAQPRRIQRLSLIHI